MRDLRSRGTLVDVTATRTGSGQRTAYQRDASSYDSRTASYHKYRRESVDLLPVQRGDVVLDVGCGTGLCFDLLRDRVGPEGQVVGVDESVAMTELAGERVSAHRWDNVTLLPSPVEDAEIPVTADAALFCATHDILQSRPALDNVFRHLRPGASVVASGGKWASTWKAALNLCVMAAHEPFVSSFDGFSKPWSLLEELVEDLEVNEVAFGGGYLAVGRVPGTPGLE
jgi:demethylmenaquinone methyltransferase/2-methoxy-6-polyprenyl-1,4-benzoquinol methylase